MKLAVVQGPGNLFLKDIPRPTAGADDVVIRVAATGHAVNRADPRSGENVALFGAGPIGLGVVLALRWRGVDDVIVFDLSARCARRLFPTSRGTQTCMAA
jgi:threonine dehydrogenase-like Zn-dependent dehydrogenase